MHSYLRYPISIGLFFGALIILCLDQLHHRYNWYRPSAAEMTEEGILGREACDAYCGGVGAEVSEIRVVVESDGAHLAPECFCLVDDWEVDPE